MQVFIASLEQCLRAENWPAALCLTLSLPDMAGAVENPEAKPQKRYAQWFDRWVGPKYRTNVLSGQHAFLSGAECYALKCALLYQGCDADNDRRKDAIDALYRFHFTQVAAEHCKRKNRALQLHTDRFCRDVGEGCETWLKSIKNDVSKTVILNRGVKMEAPH